MKKTLLALLLAFPAAAQPVLIAPGVHLLRGEFVPGRQPDGNTIIFAAPEGLVVVDTGRHRAHTRAILDFAAAQKKPIKAVINTHWHLDHIGGNALLRREVPNVRIYASPALDEALTSFLANYAKQLEEMIGKTEGEQQQSFKTELALIQSGRKLAPDVVIAKSGKRTIAGRQFDIRLATHAVTAGDLWIRDPKSGTVIAGDLITLPFPFLDTACPQRWQTTLAELAKSDFKRVVPGHGPVMQREDVDRYRRAYDNLLACGKSEKTNAECADGWITDIGALVAESEQDFVRKALDYYVTGFLRPSAKTGHLCP